MVKKNATTNLTELLFDESKNWRQAQPVLSRNCFRTFNESVLFYCLFGKLSDSLSIQKALLYIPLLTYCISPSDMQYANF